MKKCKNPQKKKLETDSMDVLNMTIDVLINLRKFLSIPKFVEISFS
jgi:hypothetical protein